MKKKFLLLFTLCICTAHFLFASEKPNIIFFLTDDQGYGDLGCYGSEDIATPHIDKLREQGMKFTSFYVHNRCSPTRAAFMTGCRAERVDLGHVVYWRSRKGIHPDEITIAELLKEAGYATGIIGKWHLGDWPQFNPTNHGFDYFYGLMTNEHIGEKQKAMYRNKEIVEPKVVDTDGVHSPKFMNAGIEFIKTHKDHPFFLYYASPLPHAKWIPNERFKGSSKQGAYGDVVQEIDWQVRGLMETLDELGIADNTLFIFVSDNGPQLNIDGHGSAAPLRDGKWTNFEGGIRVPCVMRWPAKIPTGSTNHEITSIFDILPTFCDITGIDVPSDRIIDGRSILPYLLGEELDTPIHDTFITGSTIRHKNWKLYLAREEKGGAGNRGMQGRMPTEKGSLFNLKDDVGETTNVSAKYPEIVEELTRMAEAYQKEFAKGLRKSAYVENVSEEFEKMIEAGFRRQKEMIEQKNKLGK